RLRIFCKVELLFRDREHFACLKVQIGRERVIGQFERFNDHVELYFSSHVSMSLAPILSEGYRNRQSDKKDSQLGHHVDCSRVRPLVSGSRDNKSFIGKRNMMQGFLAKLR